MQRLNLLFFLFWAFFIVSCDDGRSRDCHDDGTCPPEYYRFELGELKPYLWAKPGSYWIYKNTKTGDLDTQTCTGFYFDSAVSRGTYDYSKHISIKYDVLQRSISSSFNKWTFYDKVGGYNANATPVSNFISFNLERSYSEGPSWIIAIFYPFNSDKFSGTGSSITKYIGIDSLFNLQGKTYNNVVKFEIDIDGFKEKNCPTYLNTIYYWAKDVGLIKKDVKNCNTTWELTEFNIIK